MNRIILAALWLAAASASAQNVQLRPIDRATVRIIAISGGRALEVAHGTGAVVDGDGWIVTAAHVVDGADHLVIVRPGDDDGQPARTVWLSEEHDLAIVRYRGSHEPSLPMAQRERLELGQTVTTSGYPLDVQQRWPAASTGELGRPLNDGRVQLSISVNPGNSGGPVVVNGRTLVGVVSLGANPQMGAQGIAIMEPIAPAIAALRHAMAAREEAPPRESAVTELILEQLGIRDMPSAEDRVARLHEIATDDPATAALVERETTLLVEDVLAEAGVSRIDQLDPRRRALLASLDAPVQGRNQPATDAPSYTVPVAAVGPMTDITGPATGPSPFPPVSVYSEQRPNVFTFAIHATAGMDIDADSNADIVGGGEGGLTLAARLAVLHFDMFRFRIVGGGELAFGSFRNYFSVAALGNVGARIEIGPDLEGAAFVEGFWTPGFVQAEERDAATIAGYRVGLGFDYGMFEIGVYWRELGRGADSTLRTLLVSGGVELP